MKKRYIFSVIIAYVVTAFSLLDLAFAMPRYYITDIGTFEGQDMTNITTYPQAINDSGQVVGYSNKLVFDSTVALHPFIWGGGVMTDLIPYDTSTGNSVALDINNNGQVVGSLSTPSGQIPPGNSRIDRAYIWDEINGINDLGVFGGFFSAALRINNSGQVVVDGFIWDETNGVQDLLGETSQAVDINDAGVVIGTAADIPDAAFIWDETNGVREIVSIGSGDAYPMDINNSVQVVGTYLNPDERSFIWGETSGMQDIGTLAGGFTTARSINDLGHIVGSSRIDNAWHAFLYQNDMMHDLNDLIPEGSGWVLEHAQDINNNGQIVGIGFFNGDDNHGFLLTPIPELVTVTSPNGGEKLNAGTGHEITWTSEGIIANVKIEYSVNSGTNWIEIITTENGGSYLWEVPCTPSYESLVRISDVDGEVSDESDAAFSIVCVGDTDGDGIPDDEDACPLAGIDGPCGGPVKANGCPVNDVDGDEICNDQDKCKWRGDGIYGIKYGENNIGCPLNDADGDTIPNIYDNCAWRGDKYGLGIRNGGCPIKDSDGDGMPNHLDYCAWQNPGDRWLKAGGCKAPASWNNAGLVDQDGDGIPHKDPNENVLDECPWSGDEGLGIQRNGCPITDADEDGMPNHEDDCAWRGPTEKFGMTEDGCPIGDRDGDDVPDNQDYCPDSPGLRMNHGC